MRKIFRSMPTTAIMIMILLCSNGSFAQTESPALSVPFFNVQKFGATVDDESKDTQAIQKAIDECYKNGGGTAYFPAGNYLSGSLHLRSNITLYFDSGAVLAACKEDSGATDFDPYEELDFPNDADRETSYFHYALIWGEDIQNIAIMGPGMIDGNRDKRGGPKGIALKRCKYVTIRDITIINSPNYCISMLGTDFVNIDGVTILDGHCDGIDPDCCHNVRISNCQIESWDDAIVPKSSFSLGYHRSTENITITNCILATGANAFKLGTESGGDFKRIVLSNCVMYKLPDKRPPTSGISLESVDGSHIDGVVVSNVTMVDVRTPIFLRLGNRGRDMETPTPGTLQNISISNIVATGATLACSITGIPNHPIENVSLENIRITYRGGGSSDQAQINVPEHVAKYPSAKMFGELPAFGFYCRYVDDLTMRDINLQLQSMDMRHALVCDGGSNFRIEGMTAASNPKSESTLKFVNVRNALVTGCVAAHENCTYLRVFGEKSQGINLIGNDFSRSNNVLELVKGVDKNAVTLLSNLMP